MTCFHVCLEANMFAYLFSNKPFYENDIEKGRPES